MKISRWTAIAIIVMSIGLLGNNAFADRGGGHGAGPGRGFHSAPHRWSGPVRPDGYRHHFRYDGPRFFHPPRHEYRYHHPRHYRVYPGYYSWAGPIYPPAPVYPGFSVGVVIGGR